MTHLLLAMLLPLGFGYLIGAIITDWQNWRYFELKAKKEYRTPICVRSKFYYIIPEQEFLDGKQYRAEDVVVP
jgi:hypothetical protein